MFIHPTIVIFPQFLIYCSDYYDVKVVLTLNCRHQIDITLILSEDLNAKVCFLLL